MACREVQASPSRLPRTVLQLQQDILFHAGAKMTRHVHIAGVTEEGIQFRDSEK